MRWPHRYRFLADLLALAAGLAAFFAAFLAIGVSPLSRRSTGRPLAGTLRALATLPPASRPVKGGREQPFVAAGDGRRPPIEAGSRRIPNCGRRGGLRTPVRRGDERHSRDRLTASSRPSWRSSWRSFSPRPSWLPSSPFFLLGWRCSLRWTVIGPSLQVD